MLTTLCQAQNWSGEQNLGGYLLGTPAVAQIPGTQVLQVFYEGGDNGLWTRWRNPDGSWSGEQSLGGQLFPGTCGDLSIPPCEGFNVTPVTIQVPNATWLDVFYRAPDSTLRYVYRDNNGTWSREVNLGGQMSSNPAVAPAPGTDQIEVFYRGADGNLKTQWGNLNFWVGETDMGGQLFGPSCTDVTNDSCFGAYATPAAIQIPDSAYLEIFYRGPDNTLRYRLRDTYGNWLPEGNLGGQMSSDPSATPVPNTDQIEVFYRGAGAAEGGLMYQMGNLNSWTYETATGNPVLLASYICDSGAGCLTSYSAPKAYGVGNGVWVFAREAPLWSIDAYQPETGEGFGPGSSFPVTDPVAAQIPGTNTIQIFYVESTDSNGGYLATQWYPN